MVPKSCRLFGRMVRPDKCSHEIAFQHRATSFQPATGEDMMRSAYLLAAAFTVAFATQAWTQSPKVVMEEVMVPSEPGIEIYVLNERPADMSAFRPEPTLLFVHGATYPAHPSFDLKL